MLDFLKPLSALRIKSSTLFVLRVRQFFPSNCNFSGNIELNTSCLSAKSTDFIALGRFLKKCIKSFNPSSLSLSASLLFASSNFSFSILEMNFVLSWEYSWPSIFPSINRSWRFSSRLLNCYSFFCAIWRSTLESFLPYLNIYRIRRINLERR